MCTWCSWTRESTSLPSTSFNVLYSVSRLSKFVWPYCGTVEPSPLSVGFDFSSGATNLVAVLRGEVFSVKQAPVITTSGSVGFSAGGGETFLWSVVCSLSVGSACFSGVFSKLSSSAMGGLGSPLSVAFALKLQIRR